MAVQEIAAAALEGVLASGGRVIDVREADEYEAGHVPGAIHIAMGTVRDHIDTFKGSDTAYVICRTGGRSHRVCELLHDSDIAAINVAGGTLAWLNLGLPIVVGAAPS